MTNSFYNVSIGEIDSYDSLILSYLNKDVDIAKKQFFLKFIYPEFNFREFSTEEKILNSLFVISIYESIFSVFTKEDKEMYLKVHESSLTFFKMFN